MRDRRKYLLLVAVIVAALVGALMIEIPGSPAQKHATLGLDLKGGLEVVLQAGKVKGKDVSSSDLDTAVSIMRQRIDMMIIAASHRVIIDQSIHYRFFSRLHNASKDGVHEIVRNRLHIVRNLIRSLNVRIRS